MGCRFFGPASRRRRAGAVVFTAISLTVILGFAALAVDLGTLYSAQGELQRAADAAALAAAGALVSGNEQATHADAVDAADAIARGNPVLNIESVVGNAGDVELGRATYNAATGRYSFAPSLAAFDAVRVTVRRGSDSPGGAIQLRFAGILGHRTRELAARATALLVPRDIALVIDLSGSMCWDSTTRFWDRTDGGHSNLRDVWAALNGPEPDRPYIPGAESATEYAGDSGPAVGAMNTWGNPLQSGYSAGSDPGLWNIRNGTTTSNSAITASLTARGYSSGERTIILGSSNDSNTTHWRGRVGVMLGLATWRSGRSGGLYPPGASGAGDGDSLIESGELSWIAYPSYRSGWTWSNYIDWVQSNSTYNSSSSPSRFFRYRYGLKTYTDFLLQSQPGNSQTTNLWATPELPLRAVKDAVQTLVDTLIEQDSLDKLSLEVFAQTSRHEVNLTTNLQTVANTLYARQAAHYDNTTCIGCGLHQALSELSSSRARTNAKKVVVLMSDGQPNVDSNGNNTSDGAAGATGFAIDQARAIAGRGWRIYTVSVGFYADRDLMQEIAAIGGGVEFYAAGDPETYAEELQQIFRTIGGKREAQLIE